MNKPYLLILCAILSLISINGNAQNVIYVDSSAVRGLRNGSSWQHAFVNLQNALLVAKAGEQIWVAKGSYIPSKDTNGVTPPNPRLKTFRLWSDSVKIYGGFKGNETALKQRDWKKNKSILSGRQAPQTNSYMVFYSTGHSSESHIDGFYIKNGELTNLTTHKHRGAGISLLNSEIGLSNLVFSNNYSDGERASALYILGKPGNTQQNKLSNLEILNNQSFSLGIVQFKNCHISMSNILVHQNLSLLYQIYATQTQGNIYNLTLADNNSVWYSDDDTLGWKFQYSQFNIYNSLLRQSGIYSVVGVPSEAPHFYNCNILNSGSGMSWNPILGIDDGGNIKDSAIFRTGTNDFRLAACSPGVEDGDKQYLPLDYHDLDYDGDYQETLPVDIMGNKRLVGNNVDMGAYEFQSLGGDSSFYYFCNGISSYTIKGETFSTTGVYYRKYTSREGCDSIVYLTFRDYINDTALVRIGDSSLYSTSKGSIYQWFDCEYDSIIPGATDTLFTGPAGSYAVILTRNGCIDTTNCYNLRGYIGLSEEHEKAGYDFYPNPVKDFLIFNFLEENAEWRISLYDARGRLFYYKQGKGIREKIDMRYLKKGIYFTKIELGEKISIGKILKE